MADQNELLTYKGRPLMRKDNMIYYGSMADKYIVMLQVLETKKDHDLDLATKVSVQLQLTDPSVRAKDRVVKRAKKKASTRHWMLAVCGWREHWLPSKKHPGIHGGTS